MREKEFVRYRRGIGCRRVLLEGPHVVAPRKEFWIEEILQQASCRAGSHLLLAAQSREVADLDRAAGYRGATIISDLQERAVAEYRETITDLMETADLLEKDGELADPFLHLSVHGMKNREAADLALSTDEGTSCSPEVLHWMEDHLRSWSTERIDGDEIRFAIDDRGGDSSSLAFLRQGNGREHEGYGSNFHSLRLEFAHWVRSDPDSREEVTYFLARIARAFHEQYGGGLAF